MPVYPVLPFVTYTHDPVFKFALREDLKEDNRFLPSRSTPKSTGWDVKAAWEDRAPRRISIGEHIKIPLGFRTFAPEGWWYELKPRSSTFGKKKLHSLYGTIDEDYEGQLIFAAQYLPEFNLMPAWLHAVAPLLDGEWVSSFFVKNNLSLQIDFGEAIGQIIPVKRQEMSVESISNEEFDKLCKQRAGSRGDGGFGSTSK